MALDDLKEKYKTAPLAARFAIMAVLGLVVPAYYYSEESQIVASRAQDEETKLHQVKRNLAQQKEARTKIPDAEKELDRADKRMGEIRRGLPPSFEVHEILRRAEMLAQENNVVLDTFVPLKPEKTKLYIEMPFRLRVYGKFVDVTRYIDALLHFETLTKIGFVEFAPISLASMQQRKSGSNSNQNSNQSIHQRKLDAGVGSNITFLVFKAAGI